MKKSYTMHMSIDVRGVLNWKAKDLCNLFRNTDGSKPAYQDVKNYLYDKLQDGYDFIPFGKECDNFDPKQGCLGHNEEVLP
jgi:hypothetical protein